MNNLLGAVVVILAIVVTYMYATYSAATVVMPIGLQRFTIETSDFEMKLAPQMGKISGLDYKIIPQNTRVVFIDQNYGTDRMQNWVVTEHFSPKMKHHAHIR